MKPAQRLRLVVAEQTYAICRLPAYAAVPLWAENSPLLSITRTTEELSIVCIESKIPTGVQAERGWTYLKVVGPLDFDLVGIVASLTQPLAHRGIAVFVISTFDTDYLLVKQDQLRETIETLQDFCEIER